MQPDGGLHRVARRHLAQQRAEHARQHVAAAALGHTGIAGAQHRRVPIRERADRLRSLAHNRAAVPDGKIGRRLCPAGFIRPGQTGKLPVVRREHNGRAGAVEHRHVLRDGKERVGIEHERRAGLRNDRMHQRRERIAAPQTGAEHTHVAFLQPLEQLRQGVARQLPLRRRQGERHRLIVFHGGDGIDRLRHADGHQSGAAAQSRAGAQRRRAGIADAAADDEHAPIVIFIGIGRAPRQIRRAGCNAVHDLPPGRKRGDFLRLL